MTEKSYPHSRMQNLGKGVRMYLYNYHITTNIIKSILTPKNKNIWN